MKKEEKVLGLNVTVDLCLGKSALDDEEKNAINSHYQKMKSYRRK